MRSSSSSSSLHSRNLGSTHTQWGKHRHMIWLNHGSMMVKDRVVIASSKAV